MRLKKLLTLDFIQEFQRLLSTDFEHELLVASLRNYASHGNPLRFHNFAFSMRELVLQIIERQAPPKLVKQAVWYERESELREVTRRQQLKYCAQGNISDDYFNGDLISELNEGISEFLKEFQFFNKYTHITEKYFNASPVKFFEDAKSVVSIASEALKQLDDIEDLILESLTEKIHDAVVSTAVGSVPESLSILANHVFVDYTEVEEIEVVDIGSEYIQVRATGSVNVSQEYGPKDDRVVMNESYPFSLGMKAAVGNPNEFTTDINELDVDTSSWFE
ncbi:MAG: hypothetical protein COB04_18015 [Gammaproteobacteria bacterium]|nr:MAG: hypothetical protein COB04_18015 [Gammaproteobacteria bacterium]